MLRCERVLWLLALSLLAVGAKNFADGLSVDGPLYATVARNIARTGEYFRLSGNLGQFMPFNAHPHLGFWVFAWVFKILPYADWAVRIPNHLFYFGFLYLLLNFIERLASLRVAVLTVLLLWVSPIFSSFFANAYLDPGLAFFGLAAISTLHRSLFGSDTAKRSVALGALAGLWLGLAAMYKGTGVLGYGPACAFLVLASYRSLGVKGALIRSLGCLFVFASVLGLYVFAVSRSAYPEYLTDHLRGPIGTNVLGRFHLSNLIDLHSWIGLFRQSHFLSLFALGYFARPHLRKVNSALPLVLFASFATMFFLPGLVKGQYFIYMLPWLCWMTALTLEPFFKIDLRKISRATASFSVVAVLLIQYTPVTIQKVKPPQDIEQIKRVAKLFQIDTLYLDVAKVNFVEAIPYAWYGDLQVKYTLWESVDPLPSVMIYVYAEANQTERVANLKSQGWCPALDLIGSSLWIGCQKVSGAKW